MTRLVPPAVARDAADRAAHHAVTLGQDEHLTIETTQMIELLWQIAERADRYAACIEADDLTHRRTS